MPRIGAEAQIRIVAPAAAVNRERVEQGAAVLAASGFQVTYGRHLFDVWHPLGFAGTDHDRAQDLMEALLDPAVAVVLAARGGYGAMRIMDQIDWESLRNAERKIVVGFSDITALHLGLAKLGWPTIHGPNAESDWENPVTRASFLDVLNRRPARLSPTRLKPLGAPQALTGPWRGGNLTLIASLMGTPFQVDCRETVLYVEEVHEAPYRIERMLTQLRLTGVLKEARGLVVGDIQLPPGESKEVAEAIFGEAAETLGIPAWCGFPSGHSEPMWSLPLGWDLAVDREGWVSWDG
ncbi:S66 peptidase family protein [Sulfobacillus harzensis]|uniref:LD-carboxypeptidase n=1 Tax=Sulfobacillus harzensis TaxID=2729629 RepID=A0A7Y0Q3V4_9FIRM|nr:LD-carboxypeptidase [Sulfobacillus harzensis]NMP22579.1 LD-carboxypeptidase [Sulfobacillus harzensis]